MSKSKINEKGFTLVELLMVSIVIGILLAIAIPKIVVARISANEANIRKALQTIRDSEYLYSEQDLDDDGSRDYTNQLGTLGTAGTLRDPAGTNDESNALVDNTFEKAVVNDGSPADAATCIDSKAGYCIGWSADAGSVQVDFGWEGSMTSVRKTGRKDFTVYGEGVIKCTLSQGIIGSFGSFEADRESPACE